jgi:type I restriction enzyme M protein
VNGTAAIVEFPGVMYRSGAEAKIRKYLVDNNYVDAVIQLPPDLFFGTTIATCILVLKKSKTTNDVIFIDASKEFDRPGNKNKLSDTRRAKILDALVARVPVDHFTAVVPNSVITERDHLLSVTSYVLTENSREVVDISNLNAEIDRIVEHQNALRIAIRTIIADLEGSP